MSVWHELVIEGHERTLAGFVAGLEAGIGRRLGIVRGTDLDLERDSFVGMIRDIFSSEAHHLLFAPAESAATLVRAVAKFGGTVELAVTRRRRIEEGRFPFSVDVFSRELADRIRDDLEHNLPAGVEVVDFEEKERFEPDAHGPELYAPAHEYAFQARGSLRGPLPGILEMRRRAETLDFVKIGQISVSGVELEAGRGDD